MKKNLVLLLALSMVVVLSACNKESEQEITSGVVLTTPTDVESTSAVETTAPNKTETEIKTEVTQESTTQEPTTQAIETEAVVTEPQSETTAQAVETEAPVTEPQTEMTTQVVETEAPTTEPQPETTTQAQETTAAQAVSTKPWDLLNNEPLNPTTSGYSELDALVSNFLNNELALTDDMSPYQKVWACYEFFIKRIVYNRGMNANAGQYSSSDPATTPEEVLWATDLLNTYQGCCYNYSSAFVYIMRALGYDAHLLSGQVSSYGGGTTPHCWLYVNLGGTAYTFDPDVDMNYYWRYQKEGKEVMDTLFCKNMDSMSYFYTIEKYHEN